MKLVTSLAAFVLLTLGDALAQSSKPTYSIAGTIVDAVTGNLIPHAELKLQMKNDEATVTAASGKFLFDHLEAGKYQLYARAPGYVSQGLNQHGAYFTGIVIGDGFDSEHLMFRLHPQAVVFGRVTDERGEAVRNASVWILSPAKDPSVRPFYSHSETNDLGEYRLAGLLPGKYLVAVSARPWYAQTGFRYAPGQSGDAQAQFGGLSRVPAAKLDPALDVVYPLTYYPGVTDETSATELNLLEGETQQADIPLRAVPSVHLRLTNVPPDQSVSPRIGVVQRPFGAVSIGVTIGLAQISPGEVEIAGLPPGDLTLSLVPQDGDWRKAQQLEVNASSEASVDASKTSPMASVSGRVFTRDPGAAPETGAVRLTSRNRGSFASVKNDGTFSFPPLPLGSYEVLLNLAAPAKYIQKISASGATATGHRLILASAGDVQLTIAVSSGVALISGTAILNRRPADGVMVLLLPESTEDLDSDLHMDQSNSDGSFVLANITPGKYRLLAIQDGWDLDFHDPAVLKPYLVNAPSLQIAPDDVRKLTVDVQPLLK